MTAACLAPADRDELLAMLLERGILRRTETQPVLSRDGTSARWMLDSLAVTLSPLGAEMAGRLILERLRRFDGRQVATYGLTAVPILQSAILQSGGRYHGLLVRKDRKGYGSQKLIEGCIDPDEPTILIDDSIASGASMSEGIEKLEAAGLRVEGCVALVRFGWDGGCSMLSERGYHVEAVYDIFEDLMSRMECEEGPERNPTRQFPDFEWSDRAAANGLHPSHLARAVLYEYFQSGRVLRPPARLDRDDYDSSGGAWVSVRSRADIHDRHAREGFWHFPGESSWGVAEDVVRAALQTAAALPDGAKLVEESHIAVTLFSRLERVTVGELDNSRYGIVVVSGERPEIMGGALPMMPGIRDEWQQFRHARYNNAGLLLHEPFVIYRHGVRKFVEPEAVWQPSGVPADGVRLDLGILAERAREIVLGREPAEPLPAIALPADVRMMFVTVYIDGQVRGCMGSEIDDLSEGLRELSLAALADERFDPVTIEPDSMVAVAVSILYNELEMGDFSREEVQFRYRHGEQALMCTQNAREGLLLPCVATWLSLDAEDFVDEVLDKAGITRPPYNWRRFDCDTWLADESGAAKLKGAFKQAVPSLSLRELAQLHIKYLARNQSPEGWLYFGYQQFQNTRYQGIDAARQAHGAWILARAGRMEAARSVIRDNPAEPELELSRDAFTLLTLCELGENASELAAKLWASIDRHGRVTTWRPPAPQAEDDDEAPQETIDADDLQNYVPGQVLLALAAAAKAGVCEADPVKLRRAFVFYRHRFRYKRDFGQVSWMAQAWSGWSRLLGDREMAEFVLEIADFMLDYQQGSGAFITDHQPDTPGFTTAVYLEAIAAAVKTAATEKRYREAYEKGFEFLDALIIQGRDSSVLPNFEYAVGGVRENLYSSHVRVDFVQHSLGAILELYPNVLKAVQ